LSVTRQIFLDRFPEFSKAPDTLIDASLADAALMVDRTYFGAKADLAVTYWAAHLIAINPLGEMARLDKKNKDTIYSTMYDQVKRSIGAGFRVI
jgi:hypothetical protein